jgi:hypothetical protein
VRSALRIPCEVKLWRSGIIWSILTFIGGLGNFAFSAIIGRQIPSEYADTLSLLSFIGFLSLPSTMVVTALVHYIAHFRAQNDDARLQGLLAGCQQFLLKATVAGSILVVVLAEPLGRFFNFPRATEMLAALLCVLVGLWSGFAVALCQGMAWFKRLAILGLVGVMMRLLFGWTMTKRFPYAEVALSSTTFSLLANLSLLVWWKAIFRHGSARISPWNREFFNFLFVTAAYVGGVWFFMQGDSLVAERYFSLLDNKAYQAAGALARAIPATVTPLLLVMFTSRSGSKEGAAASDQRILLCLFAVGLGCGATGLIVLRNLWVRIIFGQPNPAAAEMIIPFAATMVFGGLAQAIGLWGLASRWLKLAIVYGVLGLAYWVTLLLVGRTPTLLLKTMPIASALAFGLLCVAWLMTLRRKLPRKVPTG